MQIGIDLMGGDKPPSWLLQAIHELVAESEAPLTLVIFGSEEVLKELPQDCGTHTLLPVIAPDVIDMKDDPLKAVRSKKNASMVMGIKALKEKKIDAFVSPGNTGALIAASTLTLGRLEGIAMPALLAILPTKEKPLALIDAGACAEPNAAHLIASAKMGIAYQRSCGTLEPKIGLLNIGIEAHKGHSELKKAYGELKKLPEFVGNVEGREAFDGKIDVLVTDGFSGNVFLKTAEGVAEMILQRLAKGGSLTNELKRELTETEYTGALLCGVDGIVIKCHGNADPKALKNGAKLATLLCQGDFLSKIKSELKS